MKNIIMKGFSAFFIIIVLLIINQVKSFETDRPFIQPAYGQLPDTSFYNTDENENTGSWKPSTSKSSGPVIKRTYTHKSPGAIKKPSSHSNYNYGNVEATTNQKTIDSQKKKEEELAAKKEYEDNMLKMCYAVQAQTADMTNAELINFKVPVNNKAEFLRFCRKNGFQFKFIGSGPDFNGPKVYEE